MMGWGEFFSLSSAMMWALAVILLRRSGETLPAFELNLFKNVFGMTLMVPTILLVEGFTLPVFSHNQLLLLFLSGMLGIAVADTWYLKALNTLGASRTGIVSSLYSPFVILLSAIFLAERMVAWQWFGLLLVMSGVLLVTWRRHRTTLDVSDIRKGVVYGVGAVFLQAVGVVMVKEILEERSFLWTVELRLVGGVISMLAFGILKGRTKAAIHNFKQPQPWGTIMFASFLGAYFALMLWLGGYKLIDASVAAILNETNVAFIVLLAWLMLSERVNRRKIIGMGLTFSGVIIMLMV